MIIEKRVKLKYGDQFIEKQLVFQEIDRTLAKDLVIKNHYSHKWNTAFGVVNIGIFERSGEGISACLGVASFGNLMNPNSYNSISEDITSKEIIELNRLWVDDCLGGNTETILLSASWQFLKQKGYKLVQSFADGRLGCGTIYKAASFRYYGYEESLFLKDKTTGIDYHKVPFENTARPKGLVHLNSEYVKGNIRFFKVKTYRYIYILDKKVRIKLKEQPYPSYDKGLVYLDNYKPRIENIIRAFILSYLLDYDTNIFTQPLLDFLLVYLTTPMESVKLQMTNKTILKIVQEYKLESKVLEMYEYIETQNILEAIADAKLEAKQSGIRGAD